MATIRCAVIRSGTWTGSSGEPTNLSRAYCEQVVENFSKLNPTVHRPKLRLGHWSKAANGATVEAPCVGWVAKLCAEERGDDMFVMATVVGVPDVLAQAWEQDLYIGVSPELISDWAAFEQIRCGEGQPTSGVGGPALYGLALCGGDSSPAIKGLGDLHVLLRGSSAPEKTT
jgi:hypothetical protein